MSRKRPNPKQAAAEKLQEAVEWFYRSRRKLATAALAVLACLLAVHVIAGPNGLFTYQQKRSEYKKLEKEVLQLQQENERLSQRIESLKSDPKAIEKEAREHLRYARPGEVVYTLPSQAPAQNGASAPPAEKKQ